MKCSGLVLLFALSFVIPSALAQQDPDDWAQRMPATLVPGSDLIAWSAMQNPEPVQQTTPQSSPTPDPQPETPAPQVQPSSPADPGQTPNTHVAQGQAPEPAAQTFTGTVTREGDSFVLKVSDTTSYKLDDQGKAKQFEGQKVRVIGALDASSNLIHIEKIEPLS